MFPLWLLHLLHVWLDLKVMQVALVVFGNAIATRGDTFQHIALVKARSHISVMCSGYLCELFYASNSIIKQSCEYISRPYELLK